MGVFQPGSQLGFAAQSFDEFNIGHQSRVQHLDDALSLQDGVAGTVNGAVSAAAEFFMQGVFGELGHLDSS